MTIDSERFNAIENTRNFLKVLMTERPFPYNIRALRERAYQCLKHYPEEYFIEGLQKLYEESKKKKNGNK